MAGSVKLAGVFGSGDTVHGSMNREHREREREQGISARPIRQPEDAAEAAVAMAGGRERSGARETGTRHHETQVKRLGEVEGIMGSLTAGKIGVGGGLGKTATRTADGGPRSFSVRRLRPRVRAKMERERERTAREGLGFA